MALNNLNIFCFLILSLDNGNRANVTRSGRSWPALKANMALKCSFQCLDNAGSNDSYFSLHSYHGSSYSIYVKVGSITVTKYMLT